MSSVQAPLAFGKYQLLEPLAEGGMALVWRAKIVGPSGFEKEFCLKQIRHELAERREFVELFVAEAKVTVSLTHSNIVPVYELGMLEGTYFLVLELIDGPSLAELVKKGPLPPQLIAYVIEQILRGLDYAHRRGVVHRDLTPANVLVSRDGEVKIVDFGIAASVDGRAVQGGSRGYMAPEQESGGRADARSDLYALGVVMAELMTGRRGDLNVEGTDEQLRAVVLRATAPKPEDRFPDAAAMLAQVSRYLRDLSMGPTQSELSEYVRKRCPAVPRAGAPDETKRTGPRTVPVEGRAANGTGPRTVPVEKPGSKTGKQVTFATRIQLDEPKRSRRGLVAALVVLAAGGGVAFWQLQPHGATPPRPDPVPLAAHVPAPTPTPAATPTAKLEVVTVPPGAEVRSGDKLIGTTPFTIDVPLAHTELHIKRTGYTPIDRTLEPAQFTGTPPALTVKHTLMPVARGTLTLNARPWAHVTIDGEKRPDTPIQKLQLAAGPHKVRLVCPPTGHELKFTVVVEPDREVTRIADLTGEPKLIDSD
jgi:serine/threonine-protein kinase